MKNRKENPKQSFNDELKDTVEFHARLTDIMRTIHDNKSFFKALPFVEKDMLSMLNADRLTVYQKSRQHREIISKFKSGQEIKIIRLPLSPSSIAGFVALNQRPLSIADVYNQEALMAIHSQLQFDRSFDQKTGFITRSVVCVPINFKKTLLGVLQIINRVDGVKFTNQDLKNAMVLAQVIGQKFHYDFQATQGPFDYLLYRKLVSTEQLKEIKGKSGNENKSMAFLLIDEHKIRPEEVGESLERFYQVPFIPYSCEIKPLFDLVPKHKLAYLKANYWVPIAGDQERVTILIDNPNDTDRIVDGIQILKAKTYEICVGIREDILAFLGEGVLQVSRVESLDIKEMINKIGVELEIQEGNDTHEDITKIDENEASIISLVNSLIIEASTKGASDIHIEPGKGKDPAIVRLRIDGACQEMVTFPAAYIQAVMTRIKIISKLKIDERRKPQDGKITVKLQGKNIELRVATIPTVKGESAVLRIVATGDTLPFDKLNLSKRNTQETMRLIQSPHGLYLVVGPTGSGKTTTLHAILGVVNTADRKIWTVEDPVEITQPGLQQVQVNHQIGFNFAAALRAFLRADPDVVLIGEMRDQETAHIGIEASLTGHLVFSTLHTNSAPETITRLLGLELDAMDFADALLGVLAQRLMRTLCKECKKAYHPQKQELDNVTYMYDNSQRFKQLVGNKAELKLFRAHGCDSCGQIGYSGRAGIHELLLGTPEMKKLITQNATIAEIRHLATSQGMTTLAQDGIEKILKGQSNFEQLHRVATKAVVSLPL